MKTRTRRLLACGLCSLVMLSGWSFAHAQSDEVLLNDGSRLLGTVKSVSAGKVILVTDYAGELSIDQAKVKGISTQAPLKTQTATGETLIGPMQYSPEAGQKVVSQAAGPVTVEPAQISTAADPNAKPPSPWTLRLELGADGQTGNTERVGALGRVEAKYDSGKERLKLYGSARYGKENGNESTKEFIGGVNLEVDLSQRWYVFGTTELEHDRFENIDLRATAAGGLGYFIIRKPDATWKAFGGPGMQYEAYRNGGDDFTAILLIGEEYRRELTPWLLFTHYIKYFPTFNGISDYRLEMENAGEIPLTADKNWKIRLGIKNTYKSEPPANTDRLDTFYFGALVLDLK